MDGGLGRFGDSADWRRVGLEVEIRRAELGDLTQKAAAERAGVGLSAWREVEDGLGRASVAVLVKMALGLDWPADALIRIAEGGDVPGRATTNGVESLARTVDRLVDVVAEMTGQAPDTFRDAP